MTPYLKQIIQRLLRNNSDLQDVVIILPSKRARVFLQHYLVQEIDVAQFAPDIFSIESFIEHLSNLKRANQTHQLFTLYKAYKIHVPESARDDFTIFMQWGARLLKDFNDIDAYRVNAKDGLENLAAFYQLDGFNLPENQKSFPAVFWDKLFPIYQDFQALLMESQSATLGMLYQDALDELEFYLTNTTKAHYFVGFNALNKAEQDLIQEFLAKNKGEVFWDLEASFFNDKIHAAGRFIRSYQEEWKYYRQHPQTFNDTPFLEEKDIKAIGFSGNIEQAQYVHEFLHQYKDITGSVAVVLGNENLLLPVLSSLPADISQWNVTMGYAIHQLPISDFFKTLIELHANASAEGIERKATLQLLSFPPLKKQLLQSAEMKLAIDVLQQNFDVRVIPKEIVPLTESKYGSLTFSSVEENAMVLLNQLIQLVDLFEADFYRQKEHFSCAVLALLKKVCLQLKVQIEGAIFPIEITALSYLFQESLALQTLDFSGDPIEGIQIMGMLETRALDFDHILITNVNEGVLPVGKNDQSFFPFAMKKKFGLPTFLENDAIYTYHFYRLLQRAKNIHLLYNSKSEGLSAGEKSRFIRQLAFNNLPQHEFSDKQYGGNVIAMKPQEESVDKTSHMVEKLKELASRGFSPTSLGAYLYDPISFYNSYLLGVKPYTSTEKIISSLVRGTIIHDCLEELYGDNIGKPMTVVNYEKMISDLSASLLSHYQKVYPKMPTPSGENYLILKAYERSIMQLLTHEKMLVKNGNEIIVLELEKEFKVPLNHPSFNHEVNIKGKIDRIDQLNGVSRLVDYKTGDVLGSKLAWSNWEGFAGDYKRQPLFQLLLYAWAYDFPTEVEVGIISLKKPKAYVLPLNRKDISKGTNSALVDQDFKKRIEDYLVSLVGEIFDEKKSFVSLE